MIYTDGANCRSNPGPGGYAAILLYKRRSGTVERVVSGGYRWTTNNRMELMAPIVALEALKRPCEVDIYSDSQYVCNSGNALVWKSFYVSAKNADLLKRLQKAMRLHSVKFTWIRGHNGNPYNERCDLIAGEEAAKTNLPVDEVYEEIMR